jgi:CD109 antigen
MVKFYKKVILHISPLSTFKIKRFETDEADSKVVMYFDSMEPKQESCPTVSAYRVFPVAKQAPAYVTIYDYYDNSRKAR